MDYSIFNKNDEIVMKLAHYFITEENYTPIIVKGSKDEIWLENIEKPFKIIRINYNYIHNKEQFNFDIFKARNVMDQIKKKTLSFNINTLNILLNVSPDLTLEESSKNIESIKAENLDELIHNKDIKELFPKIETKINKDKTGLDLMFNLTSDINEKTYKDNLRFKKIFDPKRILVTPILIGICFIMFILMYIFGSGSTDINTLLMFGANYRPLVEVGEVWRLLTCVFLHIGIIHLLVNMYSLYIIGRNVETVLGKFKYLVIFLGSGIMGSLLSVVMHDSVSAGASGAIFGLLGSLLYFGYHYRLYLGTVLKTQIIPIIIINLIIGFSLSGIDNFAHIGGLVGGYLITCALGIPGKSKKSEQINGLIVLILLIAFLIFMLFRGM